MELIHECSNSGIQALLIRGSDTERYRAEQEVLQAGGLLPFPHRVCFAGENASWKPWFILLRDSGGQARGGFGIEQIQSRTIPGHVIMRVRRFGGNLSREDRRVGLAALEKLALSRKRVLRLQVNAFSLQGLEQLRKDFLECGFRERHPPSSYQYTLVVDLKPAEEMILASFSKTARYEIRQSIKKLLRSIAITDPIFAGRINELQQEAMRRTGGQTASPDWNGILKLSKERPDLSQVFALFAGDDATPSDMRAFSWVCHHGDHAEYCAAGSSRSTDAKIPYGYLMMWDMMRWAKSNQAEWFDMGGVAVNEENEAALRGISNFKRSFSHTLVEVGAEWVLEPFPLRARIADFISHRTRHFSNFLG